MSLIVKQTGEGLRKSSWNMILLPLTVGDEESTIRTILKTNRLPSGRESLKGST